MCHSGQFMKQLQIADNERELWAEYRALISAQIGDTSFHSFVKWLVSKINQVILVFTEVIRRSSLEYILRGKLPTVVRGLLT